jgi:predicted RNase H-like HicB family nuclease
MQTHKNSIKVNILLQQREDGKTIASVLEIPDCTAQENSREEAISSLRENLINRLNTSEVISLELPMNQISSIDVDQVHNPDIEKVKPSSPPWLKSAGIFKTDPQFEEFQQEIQSYRDELDALHS